MAPVNVAVLGATGRMGSETCRAIEAADDLTLVARIGRDGGVVDATAAGASVVVDFTQPDAVMANVEAAVSQGLHVVVGTSGVDAGRLSTISGWLDAHPKVGVVVAPNFALGAVLLMRFAREAAPHFESVEIVELHHPDKVDAPSGTAVHTAELVANARSAAGRSAGPDATTHAAPGARGADVQGVRVHSVRLRGLVAHEEVLFGNAGEVLTLRHDSLDRGAFMPGVLLAVRKVASRSGLTVGLEPLLDA
ncbi:MAG TPA: 4-hydroxy-tetrahydrodipicolinate reductase [Actinomycetes bacterium]|nr:4-hydroxy-tetrahydrodipicolinate reductase [Actinomycetes bacterium]